MPLLKKTAGIILAAGESRRMGKTKQLLPFKGSTMLECVINTAEQSLLYEHIIVLGHDSDRIINTVSLSAIKPVINNDYKKGQSTSLIKGLSAISHECEAAMFLLADQPLISSTIINKLLYAFENAEHKNTAFVIPYFKGQRGNPVIALKKIFPEIKTLRHDTGSRVLFEKYKNEIVKVDIKDKAILIDFDTPEDYMRLYGAI